MAKPFEIEHLIAATKALDSQKFKALNYVLKQSQPYMYESIAKLGPGGPCIRLAAFSKPFTYPLEEDYLAEFTHITEQGRVVGTTSKGLTHYTINHMHSSFIVALLKHIKRSGFVWPI